VFLDDILIYNKTEEEHGEHPTQYVCEEENNALLPIDPLSTESISLGAME
jgi:hypothetical protein